MQKSASRQKRTSRLKFDHFRYPKADFTASNLSTKVMNALMQEQNAVSAEDLLNAKDGAALDSALASRANGLKSALTATLGSVDADMEAEIRVEGFDRRPIEPFELFTSEFGQNSC